MIILEKALKHEEYILHNLLQFYIYEFSNYIPEIKLEQDGAYEPFNLDEYWNNENFHAFFIKFEKEFIGFALVESETNEIPNTIHEFFIISKYSGNGLGRVAASKIFSQFPGNWVITQIEKNYPAQAFWRSTIDTITNGNYVERYDENRKSIQEFHTES